MQTITDREQCCGCGACENICKTGAITMSPDKEGFLYPNINIEKCVDCKQCTAVCPVLNQPKQSTVIKTISGYCNDNEKLLSCASGGLATALSEYFINNGGIVIGVTYSEDFKRAKYYIAEKPEELEKLKGSKYVQADKDKIYQDAKYFLELGKEVMFVGLPCEVSAFKNYYKKDYENLFTVELICHGPTSSKANEDYINYLEKKYHSKVTDFTIRYKKHGWTPLYVKAEFSNGKKFVKRFGDTQYASAFYNFSRPSCYNCVFKGDNSGADITIGDYWGMSDTEESWNQNGVSLGFLHTEKAVKMVESLENFSTYEIDSKKAVASNPYLVRPIDKNPLRKDFSDSFVSSGLIKASKAAEPLKKRLNRHILNLKNDVYSMLKNK